MSKVDTFKLKRELQSKFPSFKWYVRQLNGGSSWAYAVESIPEFPFSDIDKLRSVLGKYERVDWDAGSGEILAGGNTFVQYYGAKK